MSLREVARTVQAPADEVWRVLIDTAQWPRWGPSVTEVEADTQLVHAGMRGRVRTAVGVWVPFEVTSFVDGRGWAWRVAGVPATGHGVRSLGPARAEVFFTVPWLALPYREVCRRACARIATICEADARGELAASQRRDQA